MIEKWLVTLRLFGLTAIGKSNLNAYIQERYMSVIVCLKYLYYKRAVYRQPLSHFILNKYISICEGHLFTTRLLVLTLPTH